MEKATYAVIIERAGDGTWGGYAPDVPRVAVGGCASADEARESVRVAIELQLEAMHKLGQPSPKPVTQVAAVEVTSS